MTSSQIRINKKKHHKNKDKKSISHSDGNLEIQEGCPREEEKRREL
jgi:hypothetical protein